MSAPALAEDFFLRGNDATTSGSVCSSLDGSGTGAAGWTNAAGTVSSSMTAGNSYFVLADRESYLINSKWGPAWTAPEGASLTVNPDAKLTLALRRDLTSNAATTSFGDVYLGENALLRMLVAHSVSSFTVGGRFFMSEGAEIKLNNYATSGEDVRQIYLSATVSGKGTISSVPSDTATTSRDRSTYITGDLSGFTGNLVTYSPNLVTGNNILRLIGEKSIPADPAPGETASVVVTNGATILIGQNWNSGANRIWDFGSGRTPVVNVSAARNSVVIRGHVNGSSGFKKFGYGALVFDGETDISGTATVSYGVVDVKASALSMDDNIAWSVSGGAAVHFPDSVAMPVYYLKATDGGGQSSMSGTSSSGGWAETPGGSATKTAAVMKKRYVVDNGYVLRPPNEINRDYSFGGNTLTVNNGVVVHTLSTYNQDSEFVLTIYDMRVPAGGTCKLQGVKGNIRYGWGGNYEIGEGALLSFRGVATQSNRIYANISGTGKLEFPVNTGVNPPSKQDDYLYGDLSAFTGVIEAGATGSGTKPILAFATAKSFPGDTAAKTEQGLSVANGVKLAFSASGSIGPNRGVFFGSGTRTVVDVAAGETVEISSDVSGTSGFEKTGAGTLVLTGNLKGLSGTVKVSEGTLSLPCESRCRTFTLDVAEGATVTHAPPLGLMIFVR